MNLERNHSRVACFIGMWPKITHGRQKREAVSNFGAWWTSVVTRRKVLEILVALKNQECLLSQLLVILMVKHQWGENLQASI